MPLQVMIGQGTDRQPCKQWLPAVRLFLEKINGYVLRFVFITCNSVPILCNFLLCENNTQDLCKKQCDIFL
jgi:hypothetical protein